LNKLFSLAVLGKCAEAVGKTVAGIKFQSFLKQQFGGAPVNVQNALRTFRQHIQKGSSNGCIAFVLAMSSAQNP
jgi:hypothetical protein